MTRKLIVVETPLTKLSDKCQHSKSYEADHSTSFGFVMGSEIQRQ